MRPDGRPALALMLLLASAASASETGAGLYLWELGEQPLAGAALDDSPVLVELGVMDPAAAADRFSRYATSAVDSVSEDSITLLVGPSEVVRGEPSEDDLEASFVIDYDEPAVASLVAAHPATGGATEDLRQLVFTHIDDKTYARGYDIASQVADTGSGDCTEHAVLLAAVARANGVPARVVFGVLLAATDDAVRAYGHAWTEVHEDGRWRVLDATLPATADTEVWTRHVPIMPLENEGPGFRMNLMELVKVWPNAVRVSRPAAAEPLE